MSKKNWYVVTGAPSAGKTTILTELANRGFEVFNDASRTLIDRELAKGKTIKQIRGDEKNFQMQVLKEKLKAEKNLPPNKTVFIDSGLHASIAYHQLYGWEIQEPHINYIKNRKYKRVFLLERLPFEQDYARTEDEAMAAKLENLLHEAYRLHGHEVVRVPAAPVKKRTELIISHV